MCNISRYFSATTAAENFPILHIKKKIKQKISQIHFSCWGLSGQKDAHKAHHKFMGWQHNANRKHAA